MGLPQMLARWLVTDKVGAFAERITARSRQAVWRRVAERIATLGTAEARGYVRARAAAVVYEEMDKLIQQEGSRAAQNREKLIATATDSLVELLLKQVQVARPAYARARRAA